MLERVGQRELWPSGIVLEGWSVFAGLTYWPNAATSAPQNPAQTSRTPIDFHAFMDDCLNLRALASDWQGL
jgi:hypothetical protein